MSSRADSVGVAVDFDPAVWLAGPTDQTPQAWAEGALAALCQDFEVIEGTAEHDYLREVVEEFAPADLPGDFRFLKLRGVMDVPVVATLHVLLGRPAAEVADVLTTFEAGQRWYDREPEVVLLDEERGLMRSMMFALVGEEPLQIRPVVRYHRRIEDLGADVVLASSTTDLKAMALSLDHLDALAAGVWLVGPDGTRR
ncbi:MAG: hypothetical protein ACXVYY_18180 [Oryzihumus sp.]